MQVVQVLRLITNPGIRIRSVPGALISPYFVQLPPQLLVPTILRRNVLFFFAQLVELLNGQAEGTPALFDLFKLVSARLVVNLLLQVLFHVLLHTLLQVVDNAYCHQLAEAIAQRQH